MSKHEASGGLERWVTGREILAQPGLSRIEGLAGRVAEAFTRQRMPHVRAPVIAVAKYGDSSGARGAAMLARQN